MASVYATVPKIVAAVHFLGNKRPVLVVNAVEACLSPRIEMQFSLFFPAPGTPSLPCLCAQRQRPEQAVPLPQLALLFRAATAQSSIYRPHQTREGRLLWSTYQSVLLMRLVSKNTN